MPGLFGKGRKPGPTDIQIASMLLDMARKSSSVSLPWCLRTPLQAKYLDQIIPILRRHYSKANA